MALTGNYNFKGLDVPNAYIKVDSSDCISRYYEEWDEATTSSIWVERQWGSYRASIYVDESCRTNNPKDILDSIDGRFAHSSSVDSKNILLQSYEDIKLKYSGSTWTDC